VVEIRGASIRDIGACMELEHSFSTDYVWQMQGRTTDLELTVSFREVRLPRPMRVEYPRSRDFLLEDWQRNGCFLVAEEQGTILGYLDLQLERWNGVGRIQNLVVDEPYRRKGIGNALLEQGVAWSKNLGLRALMAEVQTKNHPAISLGRKHGFSFCGYNDQYYANRDIALLLWLSLG
jgi:ribosomal protein S18 acetylase RimI-like enzyme